MSLESARNIDDPRLSWGGFQAHHDRQRIDHEQTGSRLLLYWMFTTYYKIRMIPNFCCPNPEAFCTYFLAWCKLDEYLSNSLLSIEGQALRPHSERTGNLPLYHQPTNLYRCCHALGWHDIDNFIMEIEHLTCAIIRIASLFVASTPLLLSCMSSSLSRLWFAITNVGRIHLYQAFRWCFRMCLIVRRVS